jgi:hypothetical protein
MNNPLRITHTGWSRYSCKHQAGCNWSMLLLLLGILYWTIGCTSKTATPQPADANTAPEPAPSGTDASTGETPAPPPELPAVHVVVSKIRLPPLVHHDPNGRNTFSLVIEVGNLDLGGPASVRGNVEVRARITDLKGATDIPLGGITFSDLGPGGKSILNVQAICPGRRGIWTVYASVKGIDFKEKADNERSVRLTVV